MVCVMCLLPLFLVPIVNVLPLLFDFIMAKIYRVFGWEYRRPGRVPPACPIKPAAANTNVSGAGQANSVSPGLVPKSAGANDAKVD